MPRTVPIAVIETSEFLSATRKIMTDQERAMLVDYLAYHPTSGDLIPRNRRRAEIALGVGGTWQAWWCSGDLFPP